LPLAAAPALAQEPLNPAVPLLRTAAGPSPGERALTLAAAQRAQEMGFPDTAAALYRELLAAPAESTLQFPQAAAGPAEAARAQLVLALATALLDNDQPREADSLLRSLAGPRGSAWHLREALAAAQLRHFQEASSELSDTRPGDLPPSDRPWYLYLQGALAAGEGNPIQAADYFQQAERAGATDLVRARFLLAYEEARLRVGPAGEDTIEQIRQNQERFDGTATGYDFARTYAVMLSGAGRRSDAVAVLQRELLALPTEERARADDFHLLLGLIAGGGDSVGRNALVQLLETGGDPDRQRVALQLLANSSRTGSARTGFHAELDKLIAVSPPHPILEDLLLFRAALALEDGDYAQAGEDADEILARFPGSPLKAHALGVLTALAWEQRRYRAAADDAEKAQAELPPGEVRRELGVLVAEAWFRAGDFRSAAEAYAAAVRAPPGDVRPGELMFQRVEAEIRAGMLGVAEGDVDELARDPAFDTTDRWQAEWNLERALQLEGRTGDAYARVERLLASPAPRVGALPAELRARMAWLQARLSFDAGQPERTLKLVAGLKASLHGLPADLGTEIESTGELLQARACLSLNRESAALDILRNLRAGFPRSDAAQDSYIIEANYYAQQDKVVEAQALLTRFADDFPDSPYAPYALYQAALQAERLGREKDLTEAEKLIESLVGLVARYPRNDPRGDFVFYARLKEGDLLRELNQFPQAQQVYESLLNNFSRHEDIVLAQLALAECHDAQSATDPSHADDARILFEHLLYRVDAPVDVRAEAGFNLGFLLERRGNAEQARAVWWRDVVTAFLLDPAQSGELGARGRYWISRTLLELGQLDEAQGRLDQAKDAWRLIVKTDLPGVALARARLARFGPPAPKS
jgi:TolA-binding protein